MDNKKDRLVRGTALHGRVRAFAVRTTELVDELRRRHDTYRQPRLRWAVQQPLQL